MLKRKVYKYNIFSFDTLILDGAKIGSGNVFGARSLILKSSKIEDWCIYGGSPVKILKRRNEILNIPVEKINWSNVNFGDMLKYIETKDYKYLINEPRDVGKLVIEYDERSPKFEIRILGFEIGKQVITADDFPEDIKDYFRLMQDTDSKKAIVDESLFARYIITP
ncbi:MAG: hypothetical protein KGZ62_04310 [Sulfurimonas sp.]|nr:hypothetical protein [Sulfurimonas sp.]